MNFISDNAYGVLPEILEAIGAAARGTADAYGEDDCTARLQREMSILFEREVAVYPVITGTAANALALATLTPPHGAILCHAQAHVAVDECGAAEFFSHGARLVPLESRNGKLSVAAIEAVLARFLAGVVHHSQPATISLTQPTECGTCYSGEEIAAIGAVASKRGLKLHMDGARFANALVHLGCSPADATWRLGVDVLSFGATKGGALGAEAVVFFDPLDARDVEYRRKKAGHLLSKMRFVSAQLVNYLKDGQWLASAARANALAARLGQGLAALPEAEIVHAVEINSVFVRLPDRTVARLREAGARFYDWTPSAQHRTLVRLVTSFDTSREDVDRFLEIARG